MTEALVEVRNVSVVYRRARRNSPSKVAVADVNLTVGRGQTVGLVGESGSGKSSLGNVILGLVPAESGEVWFDGEEIAHLSGANRRKLGRRIQVIFQDPYGSLNPTRRVGDSIGEGLRYNWGLSKEEARARVGVALEEVGLPLAAADRYPADFSGGQRQRIAIARALVGEPDFIVCDEPTSALDLSVQAQVLNLLSRLKADHGLSYLFISHNLSVVRYLSDEIAVMYAGRIVERGLAAVVSDRPVHPYTRALIASAPVADPGLQARNRDARRKSMHSADGKSVSSEGCAFSLRCPYATAVCRTDRPILEATSESHFVACHHWTTISSDHPDEMRNFVGQQHQNLRSPRLRGLQS